MPAAKAPCSANTRSSGSPATFLLLNLNRFSAAGLTYTTLLAGSSTRIAVASASSAGEEKPLTTAADCSVCGCGRASAARPPRGLQSSAQVGDLLPEAILKSRKRGFVIPIQLWLRKQLRPLVERLLHPERLERQGLFHNNFLEVFFRPHLEGRADFTWQIWSALMFQLWHVVFIEQKSMAAPSYNWQDL